MKVTARKDDRADSAVDQHRETGRPVAALKPGLNQRRDLDVVCVQSGRKLWVWQRGVQAAGWAERSGLWSRKMSDRVQVVLWREMGETAFSSVQLDWETAGLGWALLCSAVLRCAVLLLACCCCWAWEDPGRLEAGASDE